MMLQVGLSKLLSTYYWDENAAVFGAENVLVIVKIPIFVFSTAIHCIRSKFTIFGMSIVGVW